MQNATLLQRLLKSAFRIPHSAFRIPSSLVLIIALAAALRLLSLDNRPMHCDEAVHGVKLLESGGYVDYSRGYDGYVYNPREFHGPSLNFLTLPIVWLSSAQNPAEITETHLRLLPAIFGVILVGLVWLLRGELGIAATLCAAVLTAVSPAMVFYSRYYIQEMLLVGFTFGVMVALWRYARTVSAAGSDEAQLRRRFWLRRTFWLVLLGLGIGMMHATKETCVIALFAMALAAGLTILPPTVYRLPFWGQRFRSVFFWPGLVVLLSAASVSALFFSSLLDNPRGVIDSVTTYFVYLGRASGEGSVGRHDHPWHYYLQLLFWWHRGSGPVWTEASIAGLALVGLLASALGKGIRPANLPMARFLGIYTLLMTVVYSAMPYKTPWCGLGFLHGMTLLAGIGATVLVRAAPGYAWKTMVIALLVAATGHLAWQAYRASFVAYEDPNNPYVYAHTTSDVELLAERVAEIADIEGGGKEMHIQVICPNHDYWPLPWYLRGYNRVGWFETLPRGLPAPLIVTQPQIGPQVLDYAYRTPPPGKRNLYDQLFPDESKSRDWQLRPNIPLHVYVNRDLLIESSRSGLAKDTERPKPRPH